MEGLWVERPYLFVGGCQVWQEGARVSESSRGQIPIDRGVFFLGHSVPRRHRGVVDVTQVNVL